MKLKLFVVAFLVGQSVYGQMPGFALAKEYSKEISVYKSKSYLINDILKTSEDAVTFEVDALAASASGELTSIVYKCDTKDIQGLLFCFYGYYWNESGVVYQGYGFKNIPIEKAEELLDKINMTLVKYHGINNNYLEGEGKNVYFQFDDLIVLVYTDAGSEPQMRVFWKTFDADWGMTAFERTRKRFEQVTK